MEYHVYWLPKSSCLEVSRDGKYGLFSSQKVNRKIIFTDYWKILVLNFSEMGNTVFFWAKKLMGRWYLLITEKFLFWTFRRRWIRSFIEPKSWWKDDIYFVFLGFPWYSRTCEIWFFVQCDILIGEKSCNTLVYDGTRCLVLFGSEKYDFIHNRVRYL